MPADHVCKMKVKIFCVVTHKLKEFLLFANRIAYEAEGGLLYFIYLYACIRTRMMHIYAMDKRRDFDERESGKCPRVKASK